jgi:hypothetical protein
MGKLAQPYVALVGEPLPALESFHHFSLVAAKAQVKKGKVRIVYEEGVLAARLTFRPP